MAIHSLKAAPYAQILRMIMFGTDAGSMLPVRAPPAPFLIAYPDG